MRNKSLGVRGCNKCGVIPEQGQMFYEIYHAYQGGNSRLAYIWCRRCYLQMVMPKQTDEILKNARTREAVDA
jgi:hypothetical protein